MSLTTTTDTYTPQRITLTLNPEPWMAGAACAETDPDAFFPESGRSPQPALRICSGCDVRELCLEYALRNNETTGIYGGLSPRQRSRLRKDAA